MEYLLKASAVIFIFYLLYRLFLQRETFFQTNRLYLLIGLLTAIAIPFVVIPVYVEFTPVIMENLSPLVTGYEIQPITKTSSIANESTFDFWELAYTIYGIGVIFFLGKLLIELTSLKVLFNRHEYYKSDSYILVETENDIPPFSFFNWIVYNPKKYSNDELTDILNHEKAHARELHSIDIILMQLACVALWFNPFIWLYKKEIEQNLEFIADKKAQDFSKCEKSYQLILLKSSVPKQKFLIANNFYNSQIKKRIIMLHKSKSNKLNAWKYGLILPILAIFLMSFNTKKVFIEADSTKDIYGTVQDKVSSSSNDFYNDIDFDKKVEEKANKQTIANKNNKRNSKLIAQATTTKSKKEPIENTSITVITKNTTDAELDEIKEDLKKEGLTVKFKGIKRNKKGEITAIKIDAKSKSSNANYNISSDDAIEPVKIIYDEDNNSISIGNGHARHGKNTFVYETHDDGTYKIHKSGSGSNTFVISDTDDEHEHKAKVYVKSNGKKGKVKRIKRSKKVEVISADDDLIEIIVDEDDDNHEHETVIVNGKKVEVVEGKETIVVNGKKVNIAEGKANVVVKAKGNNVWVSDDEEREDIIAIQNINNDNKITFSTNGKNPLYILDGKEVSKKEFTKMNTDKIETLTVLKNESAIKKYGNKAKDGVIIIKTKKN